MKLSLRNNLNLQILLGAAMGLLLGFACVAMGRDGAVTVALLYGASLASTVFIALLKMIIIPLVFTSITVGISRLGQSQQIGRVWKVTLLYYLLTLVLAVALGVLVMNVFTPGRDVQLEMFREAMSAHAAESLGLGDFFIKFFSQLLVNPVTAMANGNVIAVVTFALLVGIVLVQGRGRYDRLTQLLDELFELMMTLIGWIMWLAPWGIAALLFKLVITQDLALFESLGRFMLVVIGATLFHGIVILPATVYVLAKLTPWQLLKRSRPALITAFATSSSTATMPVTLRCLQEDFKVTREVAGFVVPVGAQLNMDGTALYEAAAALFIASLCGIELSLGQQLVVCLTAMIAAVGAPGIPSAGMVTMVMVLQSVGLPAEAIAILLPIDRLLDAFRTTVNVEGDICGSVVVDKLSGTSKPIS